MTPNRSLLSTIVITHSVVLDPATRPGVAPLAIRRLCLPACPEGVRPFGALSIVSSVTHWPIRGKYLRVEKRECMAVATSWEVGNSLEGCLSTQSVALQNSLFYFFRCCCF